MNKMPTISDAIHALGINGGWKIKEGKIAKWYSEKPQPSDKAIQAKLKELEAEYEKQNYARTRASQYPSITDVVVALAEKQEGDDTMWKEITAHRQKVKSDIPKPT